MTPNMVYQIWRSQVAMTKPVCSWAWECLAGSSTSCPVNPLSASLCALECSLGVRSWFQCSCLENPPTRLPLGPRAHTKAQKEKSALSHKALEMENFGEGGKAASSPGQLVPSPAAHPWLCSRGTGVMALHPSRCAQPEPGRYIIFLFITSGCIQHLSRHQQNNSSFRH